MYINPLVSIHSLYVRMYIHLESIVTVSMPLLFGIFKNIYLKQSGRITTTNSGYNSFFLYISLLLFTQCWNFHEAILNICFKNYKYYLVLKQIDVLDAGA